MKKTPKRILALLLSLIMVVGMLATSALAAPPDGGEGPGGPDGPGGPMGPMGPGGSDTVEEEEPVTGEVLTETVTFENGHTFEEGENYIGEEGYAVVMTVDGVQMDIKPGAYEGKVVLNVIKTSTGSYANHGAWNNRTMTAALSFDDKGLVSAVEPALQNITWSEKDGVTTVEGKDGRIVSKGDYFGGLRFTSGDYTYNDDGDMMSSPTYSVTGGGKEYVVKGITIDLTGNGGDDFAGIGAAIAVVGNARVTVEDCPIITSGALRSAVFAGNDAEVTIKNCTIETKSLWADESKNELQDVTIPGAGMTVPPAGLGVYGNNRANNMVGAPNVTYENCTITADSWGAMACDAIYPAAGEEVFQNLVNCTINVDGAGYGAYAIGHIWDNLVKTTINVKNGMGIIVAAEGSTKMDDNSKIISERFGIVTHQGMGAVAGIVVTGSSSIEARYTGILVKERAADIEISNGSTITVTDGALIQAVDNDDKGASGGETGEEKVTVDLKDVALVGDILQSMSNIPMEVSMTGATLTGAVSTATPTFQNGGNAPGMMDVAGYTERAMVGVITENKLETGSTAGLTLTLGEGAKWVVTEDSFLTNLTANSGAITAEGAVTITVSGTLALDGEEITGEKTVGSVTYKVAAQADAPAIEIPESGTASPASSAENFTVNGKKVDAVNAYVLKDENGNETNFLRIRDVAELLKDTDAKFNVFWNGRTGKVEIVNGENYVANGSEGKVPFNGAQAFTKGSQSIVVNGEAKSIGSIVLTDNNGGGYTYFGLRAL